MKSNHKNAIIGGLLAVVFVMAVGYAAFAQQLTINGTANITSNWDVHFNPAFTGTTQVDGVTPVNVVTGKLSDGTTSASTAPTGTITYDATNTVATLSATLTQPGDSITFTLRPTNYSTGLNAVAAGNCVLAQGTGESGLSINGLTATKGHIKFTVTNTTNTLQPNATAASSSYDSITVKAEYTAVSTNESNLGPTTAVLKITRTYNQANS